MYLRADRCSLPHKLLLLAAGFLLLTWAAGVASATTRDLKVDFYNTADGSDYRPAFARAFAALNQPGDVLTVSAGTYYVQLTAAPLGVPAGVTVRGTGAPSILNLGNTGSPDAGYWSLFKVAGSGATVEGLTIQRAGDFKAILLLMTGLSNPSNITVRNCSIIGRADLYTTATNYCHAFLIGNDIVANILIEGCTVSTCNYGLIQLNTSTGTVNGITVRNCRFNNNYSTDLEFNAPNRSANVNHVLVSGCTFADNQNGGETSGWAVGLAHIQTAAIENCTVTNYLQASFHVEDASTNVTITGNTLLETARQTSNPILVLSQSDNVRIEGNYLRAAGNTHSPYLIQATAGSSTTANYPTNVHVNGNTLVYTTRDAKPWYLQTGSNTDTPAGNVFQLECEGTQRSATGAVATFAEPGLSNGKAQRLSASAVGTNVVYTLPGVPAGTYTVLVGVKKEPSCGQFQLSLDGGTPGAAQDEYAAGGTYARFNLGDRTFGALADHTFTFTVAGKSSAASGYDLTFDYIELVAGGTGAQTVASIGVSPASANVDYGASQSFAGVARSQYGAPMSLQPSFVWSVVSGPGTINASTGVYAAPLAAGSAMVQAASAGVTGTASVGIFSPATTLNVASSGSGSRTATLALKNSVVGRTYQAEFTGALVNGSWQNTGAAQSGTGSELQFIVPAEDGVGARFYRVEVR